ncbi:HAD-IA family hydrolase [Candidatus Woesearchaeota archaeon]|nr:HAD-IA family hydrolase [Candidatus Woesearchaeota archaeon]
MIEVIYWDLGGVCVTDNVAPVFEEYRIGYGKQQKEAWAKQRVGKITLSQFFDEALKGTCLESKIQEIKQRAQDIIQIQPNGAVPIVKQLHGQKKYRQGVLSNHSIEWGNYILDNLSLRQYFDPSLIIVSEQVQMSKPDPLIFHLAHRLAFTDPDKLLFFDNQEQNVEAARKSGLNAELFIDTDKAVNDLIKYGIKIKDHEDKLGGK